MLNQDFKEFIKSLNDNHVRYLVIEGYAVALHGYPRYTKDIDIWVDMSPSNAARKIWTVECELDLSPKRFLGESPHPATRLADSASVGERATGAGTGVVAIG
jgi:hypothetical protein